MNRPLFSDVTHIEGMDLAGKSTATAHLVVSTRHGLQRNSLVPNNPIYAEADRLRRNGAAPDVLGPMYVRALDWDLNHMTSGRPRVQDSTILLRSLAFYEVLGHDQIVDQLHAMIPRHPRFGCTIVLTASIEARLVRLAERQRLAPDEVAGVVLALCSGWLDGMRGQVLTVDHGTAFYDNLMRLHATRTVETP